MATRKPWDTASDYDVRITWAETGFALVLSSNPNSNETAWTLTATADQDVGFSSHWIPLYDEDGQFLTRRQSGTACGFTKPVPPLERHQIAAFISSEDSAYPPANVQASSNTLSIVNPD